MKETELSWEMATARLLQEYEEKAWSAQQCGLGGVPKASALFGQSVRARNGPQRGGRAAQRFETRLCYICNKVGHIARDHHKQKLPGGLSENRQAHSEGANAHGTAYPATMLMAMRATASAQMHGKLLLMDSGASENMVGHVDWLHNIEPISPHPIRLGDGKVVFVTYKGELWLRITLRYGQEKYHRDLMLQGVLYVPELKSNFLSCSALCDNGFRVNFGSRMCNAMRHGVMMMQGNLCNGVYVLDVSIETSHPEGVPSNLSYENHGNDGVHGSTHVSMALASTNDYSKLWHARLGHANWQ